MADFSPYWVPYIEEPYYQNIVPNFRPSLRQPVGGLGRGSSLPPGMLAGFHRPVIGWTHMSPLSAYQHGIGKPVRPQVEPLMKKRVVEHKTRTQSVTHKGNAKNAVNSIRERYGGTGVFLPVPHQRPYNETPTSENAKQKNEAKEIEAKKEGESDSQLPPGIFLPPEWIY